MRPVLRLNFAHYKKDVARAIFPEDADLDGSIAGPHPIRMLFVGDVAVAGYGVLKRGMTVSSRVAAFVAHARQSGCEWRGVARTDLTAAGAAALPELIGEDADVALIMLGVPDVLLATSPVKWACSLQILVERLRDAHGSNCRIVFAGIPPMADFRRIPPLARKLLTDQIARLDQATMALCARLPDAVFVPFPSWRVGEMYVEQAFSWRALHEMWAHVLAQAVTPGSAGERADHRGVPMSPGRSEFAG